MMTRSLVAVALAAGLCLAADGQDPTSRQPTATPAAVPAQVSFTEHIAPLVFSSCASCHRPGESGPFPLLTYQDVRKRAKLIQEVVEKRTMPPWHPAPGHGEFLHERRLSDAQVALVKHW